MTLLGERVLVKMNDAETTTKSGIILAKEDHVKNVGVVVAIGNKVDNFKVGDIITKYKYTQGIPINFKGVEHLILQTSIKKCEIEFISR